MLQQMFPLTAYFKWSNYTMIDTADLTNTFNLMQLIKYYLQLYTWKINIFFLCDFLQFIKYLQLF